MKKVEAMLVLLEDAGFEVPPKDAKRLRSARHALSPLRDAEVTIETLDRLLSTSPGQLAEHTAAIIRAQLTRDKSGVARLCASTGRSREPSTPSRRRDDRSSTGRRRRFRPRTFRASCSTVLARANAQCSLLRDGIEWRISTAGGRKVKHLWYQLRLAEPFFVDLHAELRACNTLETELGEEHNLAALREKLLCERRLGSVSGAIGTIAAMAMRAEERRRRSALVLGKRLHSITPRQFANDLKQRLRPEGVTRMRQIIGAVRAGVGASRL